MRIITIVSVFTVLTFQAFCTSKVDSALQKKLFAMFREDQKWRIEYNKLNSGKKSEFDEDTVNSNMEKADSVNMLEAKKIINKYGFPGYSLVDTIGSNRFWAIVQHCDDDVAFQLRVVQLMGKEVEQKNASGPDYAFLQDRVLVNEGKKQLYGTQIKVDLKTGHPRPFPVQDSLNLDKRRMAVGLTPIKEYLKLFEHR